ncbi:helix-turn-helix transcriptional regulator [Actinomadura gamaensis]|uniref:Helix-turn-helix transcriptional regulator n=1 Tax=Actinomadura gamaensis TaxID=1763541 RepID=A0ABV9TSS9_9ACTN
MPADAERGLDGAARGSGSADQVSVDGQGKPWTFLTNHARVLVHIARNPHARVRDVAVDVGITERTAQSILNDLEKAAYLTRVRVGRRNHYTIHPDRPFRHPTEARQSIAGLIELLTDPQPPPDPPDASSDEPDPTVPNPT